MIDLTRIKNIKYLSATSSELEFIYPSISGTFSLLSDLDLYLPLTGGKISGDIEIAPGVKLIFDEEQQVAMVKTEDTATHGSAYYVLFIPETNHIYVSQFSLGTVKIYNTSLELVDEVSTGSSSYYMAYNSNLGRVYVGRETTTTELSYIDINTFIVTTVNTGETLQVMSGLVYNSVNSKIVAYNYLAEELYVLDEDLIWEQTIPVHSGINPGLLYGYYAYALGVNQTTGDIYLPYPDYSSLTEIALWDSTFTELPIISIVDKSVGEWDSNIVHDSLNNRMIISVYRGATDNQLVIIDGDTYAVTFLTLPETSPDAVVNSARVAIAIDASNNKLYGISTENTSSANVGYVVDLADDSATVSLLDEPIVNWAFSAAGGGMLYSITNSGPFRIDSFDIDVDITATLDTALLTGKREYLLPNKSGTIALLSDTPNILTSKTVWVDATYGNNTTATKYDFTKPYLTLADAMTAAVSGDTIVIRPGTYNISILTLKNGVNLHFENGAVVSSGQFRDNSVAVTCRITGFLNWSSASNGSIDIRGNGSNVYIEMNRFNYTGAGNAINIRNSCLVYFKCSEYISSGGIAFEGSPEVYIELDKVTMSANLFNQNRRFTDFRGPFAGSVNIKFNTLTFGDNGTGYQWITHLATIDNPAKIVISGEEVISTNATETGFAWQNALVSSESGGTGYDLIKYDIKRIRTQSRNLITSITEGSINSKMVFENVDFKRAQTTVNWKGAIRHTRSYDKLIFNNCKIEVGNEGEDTNWIVGIGTNSNLPGIYANESDNFNVEFNNCKFVKNSLGTDTTSLFLLDGENSNIALKNCDIVYVGSETPFAVDADTLLEGNVYFKNTISNIDNSTNITDTALVSGFIGNDTNLTIL